MHSNRLLGVFFSIGLTTFVFALLAGFLLNPSGNVNAGQRSPSEDLTSADEGQELKRVIVFFHDALPLDFDLKEAPISQDAKRAMIVSTLQQNAAVVESQFETHLNELESDGLLINSRYLWMPNALAAVVTPRGRQVLEAHPLVERVIEDEVITTFSLELPDIFSPSAVETINSTGNTGLNQIRVPEVWHALGITGTGATVAIIDSGVDWLHPDLTANYRGRLPGGGVDHTGHWFHAAYPTITTPIDDFWHGTHVAGSAVGGSNLGVAPGAKWIGVSISDDDGLIYASYIYEAFAWILAPGGQPELAPDVLNGSWGALGSYTFFVDEIDLIRQAGIVPVFSAGNDGPFDGSVGSPGSYTNTFTVGAIDTESEIAWFSSRGPSPLGDHFKPDVVAPGVNILSTLPNGAYGKASGTSMAAPHVAGVAALLRSVDPQLTVDEIEDILRATARPIEAEVPNMASGWGIIDPYEAAASQMSVAAVNVRLLDGTAPLPGESVTVTTPLGHQLSFITDESGRFTAYLTSGSYDFLASPYGFQPAMVNQYTVTAGESYILNLSPTRQAGAFVRGQVLLDSQPVSAHIDILGANRTTVAGETGHYEVFLPAGSHILRFRTTGGRVVTQMLSIIDGVDQALDVNLETAPKILLVDAGRWRFQPIQSYYQEAFWEAGYEPELFEIGDPLRDVLSVEFLQEYRYVFWGDPRYSPALIGSNRVISDYLDSGGNLFISGQNLAEYESSTIDIPWDENHLNAIWDGNTTLTSTIRGEANTPMSGVELDLNGPHSAENQDSVDTWRPLPIGFSEPIFRNEGDQILALQNGRCRPFQIMALGFGLEGVSDNSDRAAIISGAVEFFNRGKFDRGVQWVSDPIERIGLPGEVLEFDLRVFNMSETMTDTLQIAPLLLEWPTEVVTSTLELGPCEWGDTQVRITVPETASRNDIQASNLFVSSQSFPSESDQLAINLKTPDRVLVVNDRRWYDPLVDYQAALDDIGLTHDVWVTDPQFGGWGSPSAEFLSAYERVVWFTSYDWYRPITSDENEAIEGFLAEGGRLFLSSQDFMYYHRQTALARSYLGAISYGESVTPTLVLPVGGPLEGVLLPLTFDSYRNNSDALIAGENAVPLLWHNHGLAALAQSGYTAAETSWRTAFFSFPVENLPAHSHSVIMADTLGWLGDWGDSQLTMADEVARPGDVISVELALLPVDGAETLTVTIPNSGDVNPVPASLPAGAEGPDANGDIILWTGSAEDAETLSFLVTVSDQLAAGSLVTMAVNLDDGLVVWPLIDHLIVDGPDLSVSSLTLTGQTPGEGELEILATLVLENAGLRTAEGVSATVSFSDNIYVLSDTLQSSAGIITFENGEMEWFGSLPVEAPVTSTLSFTTTQPASSFWASGTAIVAGKNISPTVVYDQLKISAYEIIFPIFFKE